MRLSGKWMSIVDDRVLEFIDDNGYGSPTEMKREGPIRFSRQYVAARCRELADHGLLKPVGNGVYVLTDRGEQYLSGELATFEDGDDDSPGTSDLSGQE